MEQIFSTHPFEEKVMRLALRGEAVWKKAMRAQIHYLKFIKREFVAGGFFTSFQCDPAAPPAIVPTGPDGLPTVDYPPIINAIRTVPCEGLVSFIVWPDQNGRIACLEAHSMTDAKWPDDPFFGFHDFQDDHGNIIEK